MRHLLVTVLASLAAAGVASATRATAVDKPKRRTFSVTSARQSAGGGSAGTFRLPTWSFPGAAGLPIAGLPHGGRPPRPLADERRSGVFSLAETRAILTLLPSARTPSARTPSASTPSARTAAARTAPAPTAPAPTALGTRRVNVVGTGGGASRSRELTSTVKPSPSSVHFSLRLSPAHQVVPRGAAARYTLRLARAAGFRRRVTLRVLRLPRGATASWTPTELTVATDAGQRLGSDRLVVEATSRVGGRAVRRYAEVVLTVAGAHESPIGGDLGTPLYPGSGVPLDLVLTNPHRVDIRVTALTVSVGAGTTNPDCSGAANYAVTQYSGGYPLVLHPGTTRLSTLVASSSAWPQVWMHDLPTNQNACRGAVLSLDYGGLAT